MHLHEMLVAPGFNVVIIKLVEYDVAEVVVARGTGLVAVAGKISGKKGLKKKKKGERRISTAWVACGWAGGCLLEDGFQLGCRDFLIEHLLHDIPVHEGGGIVLGRNLFFKGERFGLTGRGHLLLGLNQVADQAA